MAFGVAATIAVVAALDPRAFLSFIARATPPSLPEYAGSSIHQYTPFTGSLALSIGPWLLAATALVLLVVRFSGRLRTAWEPAPQQAGETLVAGENGRSAIEFLLLLPIILSILLLILETALMVQAKFVVNYAAFCAVRSAIVWIPADAPGGEARNHIDRTDPDSDKMQKIWRAAAFACVSISPHYSSSLVDRTGISDASDDQKDAVERIAAFFPSDGDGNVAESFKNRLAYGFDSANTTIDIVAESGGSHDQNAGDYGDHDPVTVRVTHRFYLGIPLANRLMGTSFGAGPGSGFYYPISEQYTLLNEGEPLGS
jgi:hypothetical protein